MTREYLKKALFFIFLLARLTIPAHAQQSAIAKLEKQVEFAVAKARPACVYLTDYDPKTKALIGNRFSGVVINADGIVLTVAHASFPGMSYMVTFPDGKEYTAKGLGRIAGIDASVLKIDQQGKWPFAEMGWSALLKVNEPCISIAYPASFDDNRLVVRFGYVAEVSSILKAYSIRTTCLMEPGDSGGPTFDLQGRVIGLHSSATGPVENNFEVPIDLYRKYWNALQESQDYDGFPIGEQVIPDTLGATTPVFNSMEDVKLTLLKLESHFGGLDFKINSFVNGKNVNINGTLTNLQGFISAQQISNKSFLISKNSMVGINPSVNLGKGKMAPVKIIARDENRDLVLLELNASLKNGVIIKNALTDTVAFTELGKFLLSPQQDADAISGVVGTTRFKLPMKYRAGYSGAGAVMKDGKVVLYAVQANTGASIAHLHVNDEVLSINGVKIDNPDRYITEMRKNNPDDVVILVRRNASGTDTVKVKLGKYPLMKTDHPAEKFPGGKSEYRDGFNNVFVQDGNITPSQCGGPVFDLKHKFMGINIARFSRTSTIVLSPIEIQKFIENALNHHNLLE